MSDLDGSASWAEVAASGPPQSEEEARAPPVDEVIPTDSSVSSLVDVDSGVSVVSSGFLDQDVKTETQAVRIELEKQAEEGKEGEAADTGKEPKEKEPKAKEPKAKEPEKKKATVKAYVENPVVAANAIGVVGLSLLLVFGGYKKYQAGQLTWKVVGLWAAGLSALGTGDFFLSSFLFGKYPYPSKSK